MKKKFILVNKDKLINSIYESENIEETLHEMLTSIDASIQVLINHKIKMEIEKLNFDNLQCMEIIISSKDKSPFIVNIYKFDLQNLSFNDFYNNVNITDHNLDLQIDIIKKKLEIINKNDKIINKQNPNINQKKIQKQQNPIRKLFDETNDIINKANEKSKDNEMGSKQISLINSEKDSDSDLNDKYNEKNHCFDLKDNDFKIIRPMNSIVTEKIETNNLICKDNRKSKDSSDNYDLESEEIDLVELKNKIDVLKKLKENEEIDLKKLKKEKEDDIQNFSKYCNEMGNKKREFIKNKEKEEEKRNRFEANKSAYRKMKQHIAEGILTEDKISCLFANEYPIYKFMDQKDLLDKPDDYITFLYINDELNSKNNIICSNKKVESDYVPHNIHYLNEEEQEKYSHIKKNNKDLIDEFIDNNKKVKNYPSLDEVLKSIENDEDNEDNKDNQESKNNDEDNLESKNNDEDNLESKKDDNILNLKLENLENELDCDIQNINFETSFTEKINTISKILISELEG